MNEDDLGTPSIILRNTYAASERKIRNFMY